MAKGGKMKTHKADAKVLWDQDTLAIPFTRNNS